MESHLNDLDAVMTALEIGSDTDDEWSRHSDGIPDQDNQNDDNDGSSDDEAAALLSGSAGYPDADTIDMHIQAAAVSFTSPLITNNNRPSRSKSVKALQSILKPATANKKKLGVTKGKGKKKAIE